MENSIKKFYRSRNNKKIAGVCGGLAQYLGIDSLLIRIVFVALIFANCIGIILYIILWLFVPLEPEQKKS
jgi:phage shock protein C